MKIDYPIAHSFLKLSLTTGEVIYGKVFLDSPEIYTVYEFFGGGKREIPAVSIKKYETFYPGELGMKVKKYDDLERLCGEDPALRMRVLDFALDILSDVLLERDYERNDADVHDKNFYKTKALNKAREKIESGENTEDGQ